MAETFGFRKRLVGVCLASVVGASSATAMPPAIAPPATLPGNIAFQQAQAQAQAQIALWEAVQEYLDRWGGMLDAKCRPGWEVVDSLNDLGGGWTLSGRVQGEALCGGRLQWGTVVNQNISSGYGGWGTRLPPVRDWLEIPEQFRGELGGTIFVSGPRPVPDFGSNWFAEVTGSGKGPGGYRLVYKDGEWAMLSQCPGAGPRAPVPSILNSAGFLMAILGIIGREPEPNRTVLDVGDFSAGVFTFTAPELAIFAWLSSNTIKDMRDAHDRNVTEIVNYLDDPKNPHNDRYQCAQVLIGLSGDGRDRGVNDPFAPWRGNNRPRPPGLKDTTNWGFWDFLFSSP